MDFGESSTLTVGRREGSDVASWPAVLLDDRESPTETPLAPVTSYDDAQTRMVETSADRLFIPADVLADMVAAGRGPGA